jgi:hypothetical protein
MAGEHESKEAPTLEMRLAAIEDKLARLTVTEEEMATYTKVAALSGVRGGAGAQTTPAFSCVVSNCWVHINNCILWNCIISPPVVNDCIQFQASAASGPMGFSRLGR